MSEVIRVARAQDATVAAVIYTGWDDGEPVQVRLASSALAAATVLNVERLRYALAAGDMLMFGGHLVATVASGGPAVGATPIPVTSLPGPIKAGEYGRKLQDLTGYTVAMEILSDAGDEDADLVAAGVLQTQADTTGRGRVQFALQAEDTEARSAKRYAATVWRTNSGSKRPMWEGAVEFRNAGFTG